MLRSITVAMGLTTMLVITSCGSASENAIEKLTGVEVDQDGNVVSISTDEGAVQVDADGNVKVVTSDGEEVLTGGGEGELPADFPSGEIPLPDLPILNSLSSSANGTQSWVINYSADDVKGAYEAYIAQLEGAGYTLDDGVSGTDGGVFTAFRGASNGTWEVGIIAADGSGISITAQSDGS